MGRDPPEMPSPYEPPPQVNMRPLGTWGVEPGPPPTGSSGRRVGVREMQSIMPRILATCPSDSTTSSSTLTICPP